MRFGVGRCRGRHCAGHMVAITWNSYWVRGEAMKRGVNIIVTALVIIVLAVVMSWRPAVATPNTGLTQEARTELAEALRH